MDANIVVDQDILIVTLSGTMDFDKAFEFRKKSLRHFLQNRVVFSLKELNFVGSTGLSSFVETLSELSQKNPNGLSLCDVGLEYKRLLEPYFSEKLQIFEDVAHAKLGPIAKPEDSQDF